MTLRPCHFSYKKLHLHLSGNFQIFKVLY